MVQCRCRNPCRKRRKTKSNQIVAQVLDDAHDECRLCLEDAIYRLCCGTWYCNSCYYRTGECPSCGDSVDGKGKSGTVHKDKLGRIVEDLSSNNFQVAGAIFVKFVVWLNIIGWPFTYFISQLANDDTLHGYKCVGYFPPCKYELCVNFVGILENGSRYSDPFPEAGCGSKERCRRLCTKACVIDERVYAKTRGRMGLDMCKIPFNQEIVVVNDNFEGDVQVPKGEEPSLKFDADFNAEYVRRGNEINSDWTFFKGGNPSYRISALWSDVRNGNPLDICGSAKGKQAMVFAGQKFRDITTYALNIEYGGYISFSIKFGGFIYDTGKPHDEFCRAAFNGDMFLVYSIDNQASWQPIEQFGAQVYKSPWFFNLTVDIPKRAWTTSTYIRFEQRDFKISDDFVALDNVTIIANALPPDWETLDPWRDAKAASISNDADAQCCFNSRKCAKGYGAAKPEKPTSEECGVYSGHNNFAEETQMATTGESMVLMWLVSVLLGCAIDTKYTNHKFLRNLMARLGLRHKPTRESRLPPAHEVRERKEHKHRYLVETSLSNSKMEVITFTPDEDRRWQNFFFTIIPLNASCLAALAVLRALNRGTIRIDTATSLTAEVKSVHPIVFWEYFLDINFNANPLLLAIILVLIEVPLSWYVSWVRVGIPFLSRTPTFQVFHRTDDLPKNELITMDRLIINGDEENPIFCERIMSTEEATIMWTKVSAAFLVISSFPWGLLMFLTSEFLPSGITLLISLFACLKLFGGPMLLHKFLLIYPWFIELRQDNIREFANGCCSRRCMTVGGVLAGVAFPTSGLVFFVFWIIDLDFFLEIPPFMYFLFPISMMTAAFGYGGVLGWGRRYAMEPNFYMCSVREPLLITFKNKENYGTHENHAYAEMLHQNTMLMCPVMDNFALGEAVRCEEVEYDRNIEEVFQKGFRAQVTLELDYGTALQSYEKFTTKVKLDISKNIKCPLYGLILENIKEGSTIVNFLVTDEDGVKELEIYDKATQVALRMEKDGVSAYKAELAFKAEATMRTERFEFPNLEDLYGFPIKAIGMLRTAKKPVRLRGQEVVESDEEKDNDSAEDSMNKNDIAVGESQIIISGYVSEEELPSDDSLAEDDEWGYGLKGTAIEQDMRSPFSQDGEDQSMLGDAETPEIKTMFKSYRGSHDPEKALGTYPEHIREMMASIQLSCSPQRQKQCRRASCLKFFTDDTNRGDVCSYHPGKRIFRVRDCLEGETPTPGETGVKEQLWTCCGQPYIDFSKAAPPFTEGLPCKQCSHWG